MNRFSKDLARTWFAELEGLTSVDEYRKKLESAASTLKAVSEDVSIRGDHAGQFVFATAKGRAIELSQAKDGIWVEFWDTDADSPCREFTYDSYQAAVAEACFWLSGEQT